MFLSEVSYEQFYKLLQQQQTDIFNYNQKKISISLIQDLSNINIINDAYLGYILIDGTFLSIKTVSNINIMQYYIETKKFNGATHTDFQNAFFIKNNIKYKKNSLYDDIIDTYPLIKFFMNDAITIRFNNRINYKQLIQAQTWINKYLQIPFLNSITISYINQTKTYLKNEISAKDIIKSISLAINLGIDLL